MSAQRKAVHPPPIEIKDFTLAEIEAGIAKLRRRLEEMGRLNPATVRFNAPEVEVAESNIRQTVLEIFGPNSPEAREHQYHEIYRGPRIVAIEPHERQEYFALGVPRTITILEGLVTRLEEKRHDLAGPGGATAPRTLQGAPIHTRIASVCEDLFRDGHHAEAVLEASKALVNLVKEKARVHDLDGTPLMQRVFSVNQPVLAFNDLASQTDKDEQQGMMFLYAGAVLGIRNPRAHENRDDDAREAFERIVFISMLAHQLDKARRT